MSRSGAVHALAACLVVCLPRLAAGADGAPLLEWRGLDPGPHPVGFRSWVVTDDTRTLGRPVDLDGRPRQGFGSRRVRVALWYPAAPGGPSRVMRWGDYLPLLTLAGTAAAAEAELTALRVITPGASPEAAGLMDRFRARPVLARRDARPAPGRFPVVVYAPGADYPVFDNSVLCELLASHGFVVIASPTHGAVHKALGFTAADLEAGARDLELLTGLVRTLPHADPERLAAMGFSWGGGPAGLLAMRHGRVRALVSLDSMLGDAANTRRAAGLPGFDPGRLRLPVLALATEPGRGVAVEAGSALAAASQADLTHVTLGHADHHDLSSFSGLLRRSARPASAEATATYELLCRAVLSFLDATLRGGAFEPAFDPALARAERRPAVAPAPSPDDLQDLLEARGVPGALEVLRARRAAAGAGFAALEPAINMAGYMALARGQAEAALELFRFNAEAFPASFNAWDSLAEGLLQRGELAEAERCYGEARARVERDPGLAAEARAAHLARIDAALTGLRERRGGDPAPPR